MANFQNKYFYDSDDNSTAIFRFLDTVGDGTGTKEAAADFSVTADDFFIQPGVGEVFVLESLTVEVTGDKNAISGALPNGLTMQVLTSADALVLDLLDGETIQQNSHWKRYGFDTELQEGLVGQKRTVSFRLDMSKTGRSIILTNQEKFNVNLNDDFSGLDSMRFFVKGFEGFGASTAGVNTSVWG